MQLARAAAHTSPLIFSSLFAEYKSASHVNASYNTAVSTFPLAACRKVIVGRVSIPPNTSLPKHWHPGEEFVYGIEGSVKLWQEGKADIIGKR